MNYEAVFRSNYFRVKNVPAFKRWCQKLDLTHIHGKRGYHGFLRSGPVPNTREDADGEVVEIDFHQELATHLRAGEVAIVMEVGKEGMRYLIGSAVAVRSDGRTMYVGLDTIYRKIQRHWKCNPTQCEY
jgi:hypothetical protein